MEDVAPAALGSTLSARTRRRSGVPPGFEQQAPAARRGALTGGCAAGMVTHARPAQRAKNQTWTDRPPGALTGRARSPRFRGARQEIQRRTGCSVPQVLRLTPPLPRNAGGGEGELPAIPAPPRRTLYPNFHSQSPSVENRYAAGRLGSGPVSSCRPRACRR